MMHTKLIRMKWEMVWDKLKVDGVDQGQVCGPGVPLQVYEVVQDDHDAHQTDRDEVGNVLGYTPGRWS